MKNLEEVSKEEALKIPEAFIKNIDVDLANINYKEFDEDTLFELIKLIITQKKSDKLTVNVGNLINGIMGAPIPRNNP